MSAARKVFNQEEINLIKYVQKNGRKKSYKELGEQFNGKITNPEDWAYRVIRYHSKVDLSRVNTGEPIAPVKTIQENITEKRLQQQVERLTADKDALYRAVIDLENKYNAYKKVRDYEPERLSIPRPSGKDKHEATAVVQWSDWHCDETVKKSRVNGLNEYNPDVAKARAKKLFENTVKVLVGQRSLVDIPNLIVQLGGDFIGGYIHDELQQTNSMEPIMGIFFAKDLITSGIDYLLEHSKCKKLVFVCNRGNHGRLTKKMHMSNDHAMNLEAFLFMSLQWHYKDNEKVTFIIDESNVLYYNVYDKDLRFIHGHELKYKGGIGGMTVPLVKFIHRMNETKKAFYNFICDKHTLCNPTPDSQINGSLKGYDGLCSTWGIPYEEPRQSFTLIDSKYGITVKTKIVCE